MVQHPDYQTTTRPTTDIAILKLTTPIDFEKLGSHVVIILLYNCFFKVFCTKLSVLCFLLLCFRHPPCACHRVEIIQSTPSAWSSAGDG